MKRFTLVLGLILVTSILYSSSGLMAQDPDDPGEPDTLYFSPGGMHSPTGDTIWIWPGVFPQDVVIHVNSWNDNDVLAITCVFTDTCNGPPCYAELDSSINNGFGDPKCFEGSRVEHFNYRLIKLTYFPPQFYFHVTKQGAPPMPPGDGLLAALTFTVFDTGRICLDTSFFPPSVVTDFFSVERYIPVFKQKDFVIANCGYSHGDPNYDDKTDIVDVVYLANYVFRSGPPPCFEKSGDANCDDEVNVTDIVYLIGYLFKGGPAPGYCP
jgi:hypothetical protein